MDAKEKARIDRSHDWANVVFGAVLIIAPWLYGYAGKPVVAETGWATGAVVMIMALATILRFAEWEEWVEIALGIWIIAAPMVLSFKGVELAVQVHVIIGVALIISTGMKLLHLHRRTPVPDAG